MRRDMVPVLADAVLWAEHEAKKPPRLSQWNQADVYTPAEVNAEHGKRCGSSYCIAGWIVAMHYGVENPYKAVQMSVMTHAAKLLGLSFEEELELFAATNSIVRVREVAEEIAGEPL